MSRSPDDPARSVPPPAAPDGGAGFDLRGLPAWFERIGLPPDALVAADERLVEPADGDELAARFLSGWCPPAFIAGCSQAALTDGPRRALVRNHDHPASRLEGFVVRTASTGRRVIGMSDCPWGLLDGLNDAGLAVSLTVGGRKAAGEGFGHLEERTHVHAFADGEVAQWHP
jgi:Acyl-coenzyme A:6-aminopenicillanic acid acyl-transferase